jgi:hypothetical protein
MNTVRLLAGFLAAILLVAALYPGCTPETEPQSLAEALAVASRTQMPILVEFYSDG